MELLTERLRLRSCREEDLKPLAAAIAPPAVSDWLCNLPSPYTLADARNFMRRTAALEKGWEGVVALRDSGTLIGGVRLTMVGDEEADLGYWIARALGRRLRDRGGGGAAGVGLPRTGAPARHRQHAPRQPPLAEGVAAARLPLYRHASDKDRNVWHL
jgi:RimJ/RimL family protein N-acetyltransferase